MKTTVERFGDKYKVTNPMGETAYLKQPPFAGESVKFSGPNGPVTRQIGEIEIIRAEVQQKTLGIGSAFAMGRITCTITSTATFSGEPHYGFTFMHDAKPGEAPKFGCGWMPVYFVDNFTGH